MVLFIILFTDSMLIFRIYRLCACHSWPRFARFRTGYNTHRFLGVLYKLHKTARHIIRLCDSVVSFAVFTEAYKYRVNCHLKYWWGQVNYIIKSNKKTWFQTLLLHKPLWNSVISNTRKFQPTPMEPNCDVCFPVSVKKTLILLENILTYLE